MYRFYAGSRWILGTAAIGALTLGIIGLTLPKHPPIAGKHTIAVRAAKPIPPTPHRKRH
jgi:hypothetical protein